MGVMYFPFVVIFLACFLIVALLYPIKTVRLNQFILMGAQDTRYVTTYALLVPLT